MHEVEQSRDRKYTKTQLAANFWFSRPSPTSLFVNSAAAHYITSTKFTCALFTTTTTTLLSYAHFLLQPWHPLLSLSLPSLLKPSLSRLPMLLIKEFEDLVLKMGNDLGFLWACQVDLKIKLLLLMILCLSIISPRLPFCFPVRSVFNCFLDSHVSNLPAWAKLLMQGMIG